MFEGADLLGGTEPEHDPGQRASWGRLRTPTNPTPQDGHGVACARATPRACTGLLFHDLRQMAIYRAGPDWAWRTTRWNQAAAICRAGC